MKKQLKMKVETVRNLRALELSDVGGAEGGTAFRTKCIQWWCTDVSFCAVC